MYDQLKRLKNILHADQFILTGSLALRYHGLEVSVKDLDIILINPTSETLSVLKVLCEVSPVYTNVPSEYKGRWECKYQFHLGGVNVDVFIENNTKICLQTSEGISINPIYDIVKAKQRMNRTKDHFSLFTISQLFFDIKGIDKLFKSRKI